MLLAATSAVVLFSPMRCLFTAGALWALLPLVARDRLGLGSGGSGLLGCAGVGALSAASFGLNRRLAAGAAWITGLGLLGAAYQGDLPG